ncbi:hypothetical protein D3C76_1632680 [compost metagenome]
MLHEALVGVEGAGAVAQPVLAALADALVVGLGGIQQQGQVALQMLALVAEQADERLVAVEHPPMAGDHLRRGGNLEGQALEVLEVLGIYGHQASCLGFIGAPPGYYLLA